MRAMLVDDHPVIHEVMGSVLARTLAPEVIYVESGLQEALARARQEGALDLVVLDLGLPGCKGIEALTRFRKAFPNVPVVVISATEDSATVRAALDAGARGYLPKTSCTDVIAAALKVIAAGGIYVPQQALQPDAAVAAKPRSSSRRPRLDLSERQLQVLRCIAKGLSSREIARELAISEHTVKQHTRAVFRTLGVHTRTEALVAAARLGIRAD
jgi:DNA-binding NarL/FixJ family response regulator